MVPFEMPLDAKLALAKISVIYEREVGSKVKMSRDEDIVSLINFAVDSFNEEIIRYLDAFIKLLGPSEVRQLVAQGANIYRGAIVSEQDVDEGTGPEGGERMYRGVAIGKSKSGGSSSVKETTEGTSPGKGKKVYRGRVVED